MGIAQNLAAQTIALVAALSVPELITPENKLGLHDPPPEDPSHIRTEQDNIEAEERSRLRKAYNKAQAKLSLNAKQSDCIKLHTAVCAYAYESNGDAFCDDMFLNAKAMREATEQAEFLEDADVSGIGLGLYLAKNIMERMNGQITVDTEVGRGSTFTLHLPVWSEAACGKLIG